MEAWTVKDAKFLQKFLKSDTGKKITERVKAAEPEMDGDTLESRAMQAAAFNQHRKDKNLIKALMMVSEAPEVPPPFIETELLNIREDA